MGNRAVITWSKDKDVKTSNDIGIYLHWNGGRDSVEAFLDYCNIKGYRKPDEDNYGYARLVQTIANFFGGDGLSIGIDHCCNLDCENWDNGVYVCEGWNIVGRQYYEGEEQSGYDRLEMLLEINAAQPGGVATSKDKIISWVMQNRKGGAQYEKTN